MLTSPEPQRLDARVRADDQPPLIVDVQRFRRLARAAAQNPDPAGRSRSTARGIPP